MEENLQNINENLAFKLFRDMQQDNLEYTYRGTFSTSITDNILSLAETNLEESEDKLKIRKRVYFIMVEGLQNITRHQTDDETPAKAGLFVIQRKKTSYFITTGNLIHVDNVERLKNQLNTINSLDPLELKKYYREILEAGNMSNKGGAGLGLIEMARKSGSKLLFDFNTVDENYSYFYLQTEVPFAKPDEDDKDKPVVNSIQNIKDLHSILDDNNILLNFSGIFNQDNLINLLSIIERQMKGTVILKMKIFNVMVEMLQNIVRHADNYICNEIEGNYGIFFISEDKNHLLLNSGNYIKNEKVKKLKDKIDYVNTLNVKELNEFYKKTLMNFEVEDPKRSSLGIIDMRIKSKHAFVYSFQPVDKDFSFYSMQLSIEKQEITSVEPLIIRPTKDMPSVILDPTNNIFKFSERAIPENALDFFAPILKWVAEYSAIPNPVTVFEFKFEYFNTSTAKQLAKILILLEKLADKAQVKVRWYYKKDDNDMLTSGTRFSQLVQLNMEFIEY